jgi:hypothetical protein
VADWSNARGIYYKEETAELCCTGCTAFARTPWNFRQVECWRCKAKFTGGKWNTCVGPWVLHFTKVEAKLFTRLVLELPGFVKDLMAIEWCKLCMWMVFETSRLLADSLRAMGEEPEVKDAVKNTRDWTPDAQEVNDTCFFRLASQIWASAPEDTDDFRVFFWYEVDAHRRWWTPVHQPGIKVPDLTSWVDINISTTNVEPSAARTTWSTNCWRLLVT